MKQELSEKRKRIWGLEEALYNSKAVKLKTGDAKYCQRLYSGLCNRFWYDSTDTFAVLKRDHWTASWRYAAQIVSNLWGQSFAEGEGYKDWYLSGNEGILEEEIKQDLAELGWISEAVE